MIGDIKKKVGKTVKLKGWVYRIRKQKDIVFIILRDSTGLVQLACDLPEARKLTVESSLEVKGKVKRDTRAPGGYEVRVSELKIIGLADTFPIAKDLSEGFIRDVRHLWLRSRKMTHILKIRSEIQRLIHEWFKKHDYYQISPPMFVSGACEGGSTLFELKYFDKKAYLTQSWQLYAEALIFSLEKIYTISPSFRAEKSRTIRHLTEFWHLEAEAAFADMFDMMKVQEELIYYIVKELKKCCKKELEKLKVKLPTIKIPFKRITYDRALQVLLKKGIDMTWGDDFGFKEEKVLMEHYKEPVFVFDYPKKAKAFYVKASEDRPDVVMSVDLLVPRIGELSTGGSRIDDKKELIKSLKESGLKRKDYEWYIDLRKFGSVPHAGFGMGIERLVGWLLGLDSIFDAIPFPRTPARIYP